MSFLNVVGAKYGDKVICCLLKDKSNRSIFIVQSSNRVSQPESFLSLCPVHRRKLIVDFNAGGQSDGIRDVSKSVISANGSFDPVHKVARFQEPLILLDLLANLYSKGWKILTSGDLSADEKKKKEKNGSKLEKEAEKVVHAVSDAIKLNRTYSRKSSEVRQKPVAVQHSSPVILLTRTKTSDPPSYEEALLTC